MSTRPPLQNVREGEAKQEVRLLTSVHKGGAPMYCGVYALVWVRPPNFPWMLIGIEPHDGRPAA